MRRGRGGGRRSPPRLPVTRRGDADAQSGRAAANRVRTGLPPHRRRRLVGRPRPARPVRSGLAARLELGRPALGRVTVPQRGRRACPTGSRPGSGCGRTRDGRLVGGGPRRGRRARRYLELDPDHRDLQPAMLDWAEANARRRGARGGASLELIAWDYDLPRRELLRGARLRGAAGRHLAATAPVRRVGDPGPGSRPATPSRTIGEATLDADCRPDGRPAQRRVRPHRPHGRGVPDLRHAVAVVPSRPQPRGRGAGRVLRRARRADAGRGEPPRDHRARLHPPGPSPARPRAGADAGRAPPPARPGRRDVRRRDRGHGPGERALPVDRLHRGVPRPPLAPDLGPA